jgi:hypothetical protein
LRHTTHWNGCRPDEGPLAPFAPIGEGPAPDVASMSPWARSASCSCDWGCVWVWVWVWFRVGGMVLEPTMAERCGKESRGEHFGGCFGDEWTTEATGR